MSVGASTVGSGLAIAAIVFFLAVAAVGVWALRRHDRMFPRGWDRTGWEPNRGVAGWLLTKFTWLSGGRGGG